MESDGYKQHRDLAFQLIDRSRKVFRCLLIEILIPHRGRLSYPEAKWLLRNTPQPILTFMFGYIFRTTEFTGYPIAVNFALQNKWGTEAYKTVTSLICICG